jgi:hypothetical protein
VIGILVVVSTLVGIWFRRQRRNAYFNPKADQFLPQKFSSAPLAGQVNNAHSSASLSQPLNPGTPSYPSNLPNEQPNYQPTGAAVGSATNYYVMQNQGTVNSLSQPSQSELSDSANSGPRSSTLGRGGVSAPLSLFDIGKPWLTCCNSILSANLSIQTR